jgi:hypothetical protein
MATAFSGLIVAAASAPASASNPDLTSLFVQSSAFATAQALAQSPALNLASNNQLSRAPLKSGNLFLSMGMHCFMTLPEINNRSHRNRTSPRLHPASDSR